MLLELWTKALASQLCTDRTAASCRTRTCSNCSLTSGSMFVFPTPQNTNRLHFKQLCVFCVCFPKRPEKMAKLPVLLGNLDVTIDSVAPDVTSKTFKYLHRLIVITTLYPEPCNSWHFLSADCVTSSYIPVRSFEGNGPGSALLEVEEFVPCIAKCSQPFTIYKNHLYVYPKHLKYDGQKSFAKV